MGVLESIVDQIANQLETMNERLSGLEKRSEYNTDVKMFEVKEVAKLTTLSKSMLYKLIQ